MSNLNKLNRRFSGIYDKNNRMVFEGQRVLCTIHFLDRNNRRNGRTETFRAKIVYDEKMNIWYVKHKKDYTKFDYFFKVLKHDIEVIGK